MTEPAHPPVLVRGHRPPDDLATLVDDDDLAVQPHRLRFAAEDVDHSCKRSRSHHVIAVEPAAVVAAGEAESLVQSVALAPIGTARPRESIPIPLEGLQRPVTRATVHHDAFQVEIAGLTQYRVKSAR